MTLLRRLDSWWMQPLDARPLAFFRVVVGLFAVIYLAVLWPNLTSNTTFAPIQFEPVGVVTIASEPLATWVVYSLLLAALTTGVAFTLGWRFAITGPFFAILLLWVLTYRNSWGQIYHVENLLVLHVIVLSLAASADDLSLDAHRRQNVLPNRINYGWPLRLCAVLTILTYFIAGWAKLDIAGLEWVTSDALRNHIAYDNLRYELLGDYNAPFGTWLIRYGWVFKPLAVVTLVIELGAPFALLGRRIALVWAAAAWLFHIGVLATMLILFPYQLTGIAFLPLFYWDGSPIVARVQRLIGALKSRWEGWSAGRALDPARRKLWRG